MVGKRNSGEKPAGGRSDLTENSNIIKVRLEEQNHIFSMDKSRQAGGELRIDGNHITVEVSNLRHKENGYKLLFIGRKNNNSVYKIVSDIIPDRHGCAINHFTVNSKDVDGEGTDLSCFYIFMIAAMGSPIRPVLKGDFVKTHDRVSQRDDPLKAEKHNSKILDRKQNKVKIYNDYYSEYIIQKTAELLTSGNRHQDTSPFDDEWLVRQWKRVIDVAKLPVASIGAEKQVAKYGHFIYGINDNYFYLGVPGRHIDEEWPEKGKSGFLLWQSIRKTSEYGYWVMVIDCKMGIITEIP